MVQPRIYQLEGKHFILNNGYLGALLWHEMGLGKTLTALLAARDILATLRHKGVQNPKILVNMPKSAATTWRQQCMEHTPDLWRSLVLLPYSRLHEAPQMVMYHDIRVIICDESHYLKNPKSDRVIHFATMLRMIGESNGRFEGGKIIDLSGTPMLNNAAELFRPWAVLASPNIIEASIRVLDPDRYSKWTQSFSKKVDMTWTEFGGIDATTKQPIKKIRKGSKQEGVDHVELMNQLVSPIFHLRRAKDCLDLPSKQEIPIDLGLPDDRLLMDADIEKPEAYMALVERLSRAKAPHMLEWVKEFLKNNSPHEQLVVFSMHVEPLYTLLENHKKDVVIITGAESAGERDANVVAFQQKKKRVIALSYAAGAESLNLQMCQTALYCGYPWTDGKLKQAIARIWRQGQKAFTRHYFLTSGENDRRVLGLVRSKEEATTEVENALLGSQAVVPVKTSWLDNLI